MVRLRTSRSVIYFTGCCSNYDIYSAKLAMAGTAGQNPQMAMMIWLMPIMILIFVINFPAALSLYWVVGNIFGIAQMYLIKGRKLRLVRQEDQASEYNYC